MILPNSSSVLCALDKVFAPISKKTFLCKIGETIYDFSIIREHQQWSVDPVYGSQITKVSLKAQACQITWASKNRFQEPILAVYFG